MALILFLPQLKCNKLNGVEVLWSFIGFQVLLEQDLIVDYSSLVVLEVMKIIAYYIPYYIRRVKKNVLAMNSNGRSLIFPFHIPIRIGSSLKGHCFCKALTA